MTSKQQVRYQLAKLGIKHPRLYKSEVKYLPMLLHPGEKIEKVLGGIYIGGYALLVITDTRLLLVDKTIGGLTTEDIPLDMIAEVECIYSITKFQLVVFSRAKTIKFTAFSRNNIREFAQYLEQRMMEARRVNQSLAYHRMDQADYGRPYQATKFKQAS